MAHQQITAEQLAAVVVALLTKTEVTGELDTASTFACFMSDIAEVVASYCGGEVAEQATPSREGWRVDVRANDSLPEDGGIWSRINSISAAQQALEVKSSSGDLSDAPANSSDGSPTYNHAFTVAFQVAGSLDKGGDDVTAEQMRDALRNRVNALMAAGEMLEAVGAPFDTFQE